MSGKILDLINLHEKYRSSTINLIPSENVMSEKALKALASDLTHRYHHEWFYGGQKYIQEIISETRRSVRNLFQAEYAFIEPLSGNIALLSTILALTREGDSVAALNFRHGGYPFAYEKIYRKFIELPFDESEGNIDAERAQDVILTAKPKLVVLGASFILFPHPVKEIAETAKEVGAITIYDGSHVLGLIAGGEFQDPLREGADILLGSTHKTFPGPQGGIILCDNDEIYGRLREYFGFPLVIVDNPHVNRIAALGITAVEMQLYGKEYARKVVENAQFLASQLCKKGLNISHPEKGFTRSHQIHLKVGDEKEGRAIVDTLEKAGIIADIAVRFGTQEVTRRGITQEDLRRIVEIISEILIDKKDPTSFREETRSIALRLNRVLYSI
ncbi:MAG: aminotransferase class I/II-fold pyridoxal phosphate-dependent enzyme [Candidatus Njordarchaeales archaeon]